MLTGNGLKDPDTAMDQVGGVVACEAEIHAIEAVVL